MERMIEVYHAAYLVCLVLGLIFLALTVFLFFKFNIRRIIDMKTGRSEKRTIERMEQINAMTGKLRQDMVPRTSSELAPADRITYPITSPNLQVDNQDYTAPLNQSDNSPETTLLSAGQETSVLSQDAETTLLSHEAETTVLSEHSQVPEKKLPGMFKVEKEILWTHAQEVL